MVFFIGLCLLAGILFSILFPNRRIWPPPKRKSWEFYISWTTSYLFLIGIIIVGVIDYNLFIFNLFHYKIIGFILLVFGLFIIIWGYYTLGIQQTHGLKGELVIDGPYKYSRNPQYLGIIILILGTTLIFNSLLFLLNGILGIICFLILPLAEEPWLKKQYGEEYERYKEIVGRFL